MNQHLPYPTQPVLLAPADGGETTDAVAAIVTGVDAAGAVRLLVPDGTAARRLSRTPLVFLTYGGYAARARVLGLAPPAAGAGPDAGAVLVLEAPSGIERVQTRRFRRQTVRLSARLAMVDLGPGEPDADHRQRLLAAAFQGEGAPLAGRVENVSGGGLRLLTPAALVPGTGVALRIALPEGPPFLALGRVVRSEPAAGYEPAWRRVGIAFVGLADGEQHRLVRLVLRELGGAAA